MILFRYSLVVFFCIFTSASAADGEVQEQIRHLQSLIDAQQNNSNHIWTMVAAALVAFMQGGFLLLEAGMVRSKNSINVAQKNITDFILSIICFYLIGFMFMFGTSAGGWIGWDSDLFFWNDVDDWNYTFFVFQAVFVGTAATILSGAVAERMKYSAYMCMVILLSIIIYPIFGHWSWGNLLNDNAGYLMDGGFVDFAGSTVVHSVGGWVALAGVIVIGARIGKFNEDGSANMIHGHSYALATLGAIILWVGWIGFNGGSTTVGDPGFAHIISNTMLSAAFGGVVSTFLGRFHDGLFKPDRSINGVLGGLVGITAGCDVLDTQGAILMGLSSGVVVFYSHWVMEHKFKLDDAVGAVPVHGFCGAWGTIMLAIFAPDANLPTGHWASQIFIQIQGVLIAFIWAFSLAFIAFKLLDAFIGIRVSAEDEVEGLNSSEHGTTLGTGLLQKHLQDIVHGHGDLTKRLDTTTGDESAEVGWLFNQFIDDIQRFVREIKSNAKDLSQSSHNLSDVATHMTSASSNLSNRSGSLSTSTNTVSNRMEASGHLMDDMTQQISTISSNADKVSDSLSSITGTMDNLNQSIAEIAHKASAAGMVSSDANRLTENAEQAVGALNDASNNIGSLLSVIRDIAEQTNLLALNATIEAARAGEAGKGFAVVANEVKALSAQTAQATQDIDNYIGQIEGNARNVNDVVHDIIKVIKEMNLHITEITDFTDTQQNNAANIDERVRDTSGNSLEIAQSVSEISNASNRLLEDIKQVVVETGSMNQTVESFSHDSKTVAEQAVNVENNVSNLGRIGNDLDRYVSKYKT